MLLGLSQYSFIAVFLLRVAVATIFIVHSLPKLRNSEKMAKGLGMPSGAVLALGIVEFASAAGIVLGIFLRLAALLLAAVMVGAIATKIGRWKVPFTAADKTGWEFDLLLLAASLVIFFSASGIVGF